jgi:site-specific DNA-methyltransferase (adenine-specific)
MNENDPSTSLHAGDCLDVLPALGDLRADFAYLDPPFNTGRNHVAANASYDDRWDDTTAYLSFLRPRLTATITALHDHGAVAVHCDWRTSHHIRLMLDDLLGPERFVNHLIWTYGLGGSSPRRFARKHDDILLYAKSDAYYFEPPLVPATSQRMKGRLKKATDVLNIPAINNMAAERVGYPTQKPLALLELLVTACSPPGGLVIDPFCGSGATVIAAHRTGRRAVGVDINPDAIAIVQERLNEETNSASRVD